MFSLATEFEDKPPTVWQFLSLAGAASGVYHGYKRNRGSVGWAIGWGLLGGMFPVITIPVSLAQGFGKPAKSQLKGSAVDKWSVVVEDGYVKVKRGSDTVCAGIDVGGKRLRDLEFTRPEYQKANLTRQKAMKLLQKKGYK